VVRLLEVFKDFQVTVMGASQRSRYHYPMRIERKPNPNRLSLEDLVDYVETLKVKFPDKGFKLTKRRVEGKQYYIITKRSYRKDEQGRSHEVMDRAPIYCDLEEQRFFVPQRYLRDRRRLVNYVIMRTLGSLGITRVVTAR